jgi:CheY-like chemotaxis protein
LAQVITNLLGNAVKFTPEQGSVSLDTRLVGEENGLCTIQIEVTDTGIGISPEQQGRLFHSFQQAESSTSRKFGGTGLGLAISKQIVEMMNGAIWIESSPGKGSKFAFTVQVGRGTEEKRSLLASGVNWSNIRILAVDDDPDLRDYFLEIIRQLGVSGDAAAGGEEALALIKQNGSYDMYFVDWKMPGMDGIELTAKIKEVGKDNSIVIMISAANLSVFEDKAKQAGVNKFLSKPLFPSAIANLINECLGAKTLIESESVKPAETDDFKAYRILLAEDVEINREIVSSLLEPTGLAIDNAENGKEALRIYSEAPEKYDMIFMDVQMPEMDGYEATRGIRALEEERRSSSKLPEFSKERPKGIPIIAMTANVFKEDVEKCLKAGMDDHIGKPISLDDVLVKLRQYLTPGL